MSKQKRKIEIERFKSLKGREMNDALAQRWNAGQTIMNNKKHGGDTYWEIETKDTHYTAWVKSLRNNPTNTSLKDFRNYLQLQEHASHECTVQVLSEYDDERSLAAEWDRTVPHMTHKDGCFIDTIVTRLLNSNIFNLDDDSPELNSSITSHALRTNELLDIMASMCTKYQRFSVAISTVKNGALLRSILMSLVPRLHYYHRGEIRQLAKDKQKKWPKEQKLISQSLILFLEKYCNPAAFVSPGQSGQGAKKQSKKKCDMVFRSLCQVLRTGIDLANGTTKIKALSHPDIVQRKLLLTFWSAAVVVGVVVEWLWSG